MKGLSWFILLFALAAGLALAAQGNGGYVLVVLPPWRVEMTLNLVLVALGLLFLAAYLVLRGLSLAYALPGKVSEFRLRRTREKAGNAFQESVQRWLEGRYGQAQKRAGDAWEGGYAPLLSALVAARAAHAMRQEDKEAQWLERAREGETEPSVARLMVEAEFCLDSRDFDGAAAALEQVQVRSGRHLAAMRLELKAQQGRKDWPQVLRLARQLEKRRALAPELAREIKLQAHREAIRLREDDGGLLLAYLRGVPEEEFHPRLVASAARALYQQGARAEALGLVESRLEKACAEDACWSPELVRLYGEWGEGDLTARIARAGKWLQQRPQDGELLLALGRLCLKQRLWGKAQNYLEASLSVAESREAHRELARLFEATDRSEAANTHYRASLEVPAAPGR